MSFWSTLQQRKLRVCYWNTDPRVVTRWLAAFETSLRRLVDLELTAISGLTDAAASKADLFLIIADSVPSDEFPDWLLRLPSQVGKHGSVWIPAIIVYDVKFETLGSVLRQIADENWYFDVVNPNELASLPIRVANLLRIHDHLHELKRYNQIIGQLSQQVADLEEKVEKLGGK
jgi:hypothetical protein